MQFTGENYRMMRERLLKSSTGKPTPTGRKMCSKRCPSIRMSSKSPGGRRWRRWGQSRFHCLRSYDALRGRPVATGTTSPAHQMQHLDNTCERRLRFRGSAVERRCVIPISSVISFGEEEAMCVCRGCYRDRCLDHVSMLRLTCFSDQCIREIENRDLRLGERALAHQQ
jgi:hypothetical protein